MKKSTIRDMNVIRKTLASTLEKLIAEPGISEVDLRAVVRRRMVDMKAAHEGKKQQRVS